MMPNTDLQPLSLFQLNCRVQDAIEMEFDEPIWLQAELSSVNVRGPHCYLDFVQKAVNGNTVMATAKGHIWGNKRQLIFSYFEKETGRPLSAGMQVMVQVEVRFDPNYGYSLNVIDINPAFTMGEIALRRQEIIRQLTEEGILEMNKELPLPRLLKRIAVISSEGAAGWGDFRNQLLANSYGLAFDVKLFPAIMQGEQVERTIISALNQIALEYDKWDAVVIIRGGGAVADLTGFDTLALAENVAQFPLPIITGIGHERDDTVIDLVSHTRVKTPTAAAGFIIEHQLDELALIDSIRKQLQERTKAALYAEHLKLKQITINLPNVCRTYQMGQVHKIELLTNQIKQSVGQYFQKQNHRLELVRTQIEAANPERLFRLGYSVARINGKAIKDASELAPGDVVTISFSKGNAEATINEIKE